MKNIYILLIALITISVSAQNSFYDGFNSGYKAGYCFNEIGCLEPIPPIAGVQTFTPVGQTDYQHGYDTGFTQGQNIKNASKTNNQVVGSAYAQLRRTEPDRTHEYISSAVNKLVEENKNRDWSGYYEQRNLRKQYKEAYREQLKLVYEDEYLKTSKIIDELYTFLILKYGDTDSIKKSISEFRKENDGIFYKYNKGKRKDAFRKEMANLKDRISKFSLK